MAPIKFEEHIKEQLEERRITPSDASWERLAGQLNVEQGKKKSNRLLWMSIAASFLIGVALTTLLYNSEDPSGSQLVDNPAIKSEDQEILKNQEKLEPIIPEVDQIKNELIAQEVDIEEIPVKSEKTVIESVPKKNLQEVSVHKSTLEKAVVFNEETTTQKNDNIEDFNIENLSNSSFNRSLDVAIANKVDEVVAQVENQEMVTDQEIEALLLNAQRELISSQILNKKTNKVDATALLLDVEAEVDPDTFRNKIFDSLKDGFLKAREAVANRNN